MFPEGESGISEAHLQSCTHRGSPVPDVPVKVDSSALPSGWSELKNSCHQ